MSYTKLKNQHRSSAESKGQSSKNSETDDQARRPRNAPSINAHQDLRPDNIVIAAASSSTEASGTPSTSTETKDHPGSKTKLKNEEKRQRAKKTSNVEARPKDCGKNKSQLVVEQQTTPDPSKTTSDSNRKTLIQQNRSLPNTPAQIEGVMKQRGKNLQKLPNKPNQTYEAYWDMEDVQRGLKSQTLIQGAIRINPKNYLDAYVPHPDNKSDIYICGMADRNRALNGDVVCVLLYPRDDWKMELNSLEELERKTFPSCADTKLPLEAEPTNPIEQGAETSAQSAVVVSEASTVVSSNTQVLLEQSLSTLSLQSPQPMTDSPNISKQDSSSSRPQKGRHQNGSTLQQPKQNSKPNTPARYMSVKEIQATPTCSSAVKRLFDTQSPDGATNVNKLLMRTGKVVYITEKKHSRACAGRITLMSEREKRLAKFAPSDSRVPRIMIPISECPPGFLERPGDFTNTLFIARITDWEETSTLPKGQLMRSLGEAGQIEPETEGFLIQYDIDTSEFSDEVLECLPKNLPWTIPASEFDYRRDLRQQCIFTIDPSTARDLDDSLSCEDLGDDLFEIGVHIADVSFFVPPDTELDAIASRRTTSVYLVQKIHLAIVAGSQPRLRLQDHARHPVIPMLPRLLCEQLCSLNPDEDRLTFSVIWKMTSKGEIIDEWFGRSVIRSCVKLSYEHAQGFIQEPTRDWTTPELPPISEGFTISDVRQRVLQLQKIAVNLRQKRFEEGALQLNQIKLQFALNKETGLPSGYSVYEQKDSNRLIEEFMLLANMAVAHKLYSTYPDHAVLRRHPHPQSKMMDELQDICENFGLELDTSSSGALQRSLMGYMGDSIDEKAILQILIVLCSKPMQNARYFCTGSLTDDSEYHHYALSVPLYTHFTSPIRRYPDIMVHRLLAASLGYCQLPELDVTSTEMQCSLCNDKKLAAKRVSDLSSELFFSVFVKECGPMVERGMVMNVMDHSFDVIILKLGVTKRVYLNNLTVKDFKYQKVDKKSVLTLMWAADEQHPKVVEQTIALFTPVYCRLVSLDEPLKWHAEILHPNDNTMCCVE